MEVNNVPLERTNIRKCNVEPIGTRKTTWLVAAEKDVFQPRESILRVHGIVWKEGVYIVYM